MRSVIPVGRTLAAGVAAIFLLVLTNTAVGQQPRPADKLAIDMAIDKGVKYLRDSQAQSGGWGKGTGAGQSKGWGVGHTALAAIALLECGVPNTDPQIKKAADAIRYYANRNELDYTYEISLSILLLDRMGGSREDKLRIQFLASRLMAGQTLNGGWYYTVPKVNTAESTAMISALRSMNPPQPTPIPSVRERPFTMGLCIKTSDDVIPQAPPKPFDAEKARTDAVRRLSPTMQRWPVFLSANQLAMKPSVEIKDCNSNTHFAALAVWAARKYDVPVEHSLALLARRFRTSQAADGSWGYNYGNGGSPSMTCVALLGLAIGHVVEPEAGVPPEKDPKVVNGFAWLSKRIGAPKGVIDNQQTVKSLSSGLYYMWAMERIAVIYDVTKLDKKDWYQWGAEILLCHQKADGSWDEGGYHGQNEVLNTSFALLFLRRANLTPDLSRRFTIDTAALTAKVSDTVEPPKVMLDPPRMPDPIPDEIALAPYPRDAKVVVTPTPTPAPTPQVAAEQPSTPPAKEGSGLIWIILGIVLVVGLGVLLFVLARKKKNEDDEKPRKKKKKKLKSKSEMKVSSKSEMKVKAKPKAEEEDDDD